MFPIALSIEPKDEDICSAVLLITGKVRIK